MLWALIISIILRTQLKKSGAVSDIHQNTEHTPGFYELDAARLAKYSAAMHKKLDSAIARHNRADDTMFYAAHYGKPRVVQTRAFMRLLAADRRVINAKHMVANADKDLSDATTISTATNGIINITHDLAYSRKTDLLKYQLSKLLSR